MLRKQLERLRTRLVEGGLLRILIDEASQLPMATRKLLIAAERSGDMESVFATLATDMADEVERRSSRLLAVLEPLLIVVMFLIIGSLLISILLPLLTLTSKVAV
jgi:type II secretory pathway component PulF